MSKENEKIATALLPSEQEQSVATINPSSLLQLAVQNNADLDKLEKLMDLQDRWEKKEAEKAFYQAMNDFQANKPVITKDQQGYGYKYADLPTIQRAVDPVLSRFGLSYSWSQDDKVEADRIYHTVTCIVKHVAGHTERNTLSGFSDKSGGKNDIQAVGSTTSYLYRYTLKAAFALSAGDDNDGAGSGKQEEKKENRRPNSHQWKSFQKRFKSGEPGTLSMMEKHYDLTDEETDWISDNRPAPTADQWAIIKKSFEQGETDQEAIEQSYKLKDDQVKWIKEKS